MNILSSNSSRTPARRSTVTASAVALALCVGVSLISLPKLMAQDQSSPPQVTQQVQQQTTTEAAPPADSQQGAAPPAAQPPNPPQAPPPPQRFAQASGRQQPPPQQQGQAVPEMLTLPAGTVINVRTSQWLSSDRNHIGDAFSATLDQPLIANGWVVARRGQAVTGRVALALKAGHGQSNSQLGLELKDVNLVDGQQIHVSTQETQNAGGGPSQGKRVGAVAAATGLGAAIGAVAGGGTGAAIGMGVGATAGIGAVSATRGKPTVIPPETLVTFTLEAPLQISTAQSQVAFQPVSQGDYGRDQDAYARPPAPGQRYVAGPGYGYPPPYYYGYCSPFGWGCYPYPAPLYLGFYGGYGYRYRGRFYVPFRR
jgi:hypothetical protein